MTIADPELAGTTTGRTDLLTDAVARTVGAVMGQPVDAGPADVQGDAGELVPAEGGWAAAAEGHGDVAAVAVLLTADVAEAVGAGDPGGVGWTAVLDGVIESWGGALGEAVGNLTPPAPAESVGALLPSAPGYELVAAGLFLGERHVGTVALVARPPQGPHHIPAAAPAPAPVAGTAPAAAPAPAPVTFAPGPLQALSEVQMAVTAELGRCRMTVQEVLGLTPGAVVELDRSAGSPIDLLVNGTLIARGEVVVVDEEFGVRLTEIVGPED